MKNIVCYDLVSCPRGISLDRIMYVLKKQNVLLFSSKEKGTIPYILNMTKDNRVKILDTNNEHGEELIINLSKL